MKKTIIAACVFTLASLSSCTNTANPAEAPLYNGTPKVDKTIPSAFEGSKTSKVQLVIFSDFQCPACQILHDLIWPKLEKEYIDNAKIGVTYKNFPLQQHQNAPGDALAGLCATSLGKYRPFAEKMYALEKAKQNADVFDQERVQVAKDAGIDEAAFTSCYSEGWYAKQIEAEMAEGDKLRLDHTPSVYLNGTIMSFKSEEEFFAIIDASLAK